MSMVSYSNFIEILDKHETKLREMSKNEVFGDSQFAPIYPIVAYDSRFMNEPMIIGLIIVSHSFFTLKGEYPIGPMGVFHDVCGFADLPDCMLEFIAYVNTMEEGNWTSISEMLLYHNRAVVIDEALFERCEKNGWCLTIYESLCRKVDGHQYWANEPIID